MTDYISATIGVDLGDKYSDYCIVDQESGDIEASGRVRSTSAGFERLLSHHPDARVVLETGTHSPWVSRIAEAHCAEVYVANAREMGIIYKQDRKSDRTDAERLARFGRLDPQLLRPIRHRGEEAQQDLLTIRSRAALVSARTTLVNCIRGQVKASSFRLPSVSTRALRQASLGDLPRALREALAPMVAAVESLTEQIKAYDRRIDALAKKYTASEQLTQVIGVGNLTAVAFLLVLADPDRFEKSRDVGAYLGLVPRRDQSGETDKQLRITKAGDRMLRTLLVQCAHYILGRNGPPCDLKRHGERIAARGGAIAKRKAVIAVARKLACLLHALWRTGEIYEPNRHLAASVPAATPVPAS